MWIIDGSSKKRASFLSTDKKRMNECYVWPHMSTCGKYFSVHSRKTSQIPGVFRFFVTEWLLLQSHNAKTMRAQTSPKCWAPSLHRLLIKPLNGWTNQPFIHQSAVTVLPTDTHLKTHICCFASSLNDWHEIRPRSGWFFLKKILFSPKKSFQGNSESLELRLNWELRVNVEWAIYVNTNIVVLKMVPS